MKALGLGCARIFSAFNSGLGPSSFWACWRWQPATAILTISTAPADARAARWYLTWPAEEPDRRSLACPDAGRGQIFAKLLFAGKNTLARLLVLVVSMGYGIVK